ncbi:MAG: VOC family protein [Pseudomonadota bacterium]
MPDLLTIPILRSPNLEETKAFYTRLGFETVLASPTYLVLRRPGIEVHFCPPDHTDGRATESTCYIRGAGIQDLHREWSEAGIAEMTPIYRRPWGMYEFYIGDPHGCLLKFGQSEGDGDPPKDALPGHPADMAG